MNGGLIFPKKEITVSVSVSWEWYDENQGIVKWTFHNVGSSGASGLLFRVEYPFGNAFWPIYEDNPAFATSFSTIASPLVDNGTENNSPPLAVFRNPDNSLFVAFIFTLQPDQEWSMLEGGFSGGMTPDMYGSPMFVPAQKIGVESYIVQWDQSQCQGYNQQSGSNFPCPANPLSITSAVFQLQDQITPLFNDIFSTKTPPSCLSIIEAGIENASFSEILSGLQCAFGDVAKDLVDVIKKEAP